MKCLNFGQKYQFCSRYCYIYNDTPGWEETKILVDFGQFLSFIFFIVHFSKIFIDNIFEKKMKYILN